MACMVRELKNLEAQTSPGTGYVAGGAEDPESTGPSQLRASRKACATCPDRLKSPVGDSDWRSAFLAGRNVRPQSRERKSESLVRRGGLGMTERVMAR